MTDTDQPRPLSAEEALAAHRLALAIQGLRAGQGYTDSIGRFVRDLEGGTVLLTNAIAALATLDAARPEPLDVERLAKALRAIHGGIVPLPNRCSPHEYAEMIARWYAEAALAESRP